MPPVSEGPAVASGPNLLRYTAPAECPSVEGYLGHVRARSASLNLKAPAAALDVDGVDVRVEPEPDGRGWRGHVSITGALALEREVRGDRCDNVVAALALITVLRLEGADAAGASGSTIASTPSAAADERTAATGPTPEPTAPSGPAPSGSAEPSPSPAEPPSASGASGAAASAPTAPAVAELPPPAEPAQPSESSEPEGTAPAEPRPESEPEQSVPDEPAPPRAVAEPAAEARSDAQALPRSSEPEPLAPLESLPRVAEVIGSVEVSEGDPSSDDAGEPASASRSWRWPHTSAGLAAHVGYATVPSHALRATLDAELRLGEGEVPWLASLSLAYARGNDAADPGEFGLTLLTLELALCPPAFVNEPGLWVRACASARGGALHLSFTRPSPGLDAPDVWRPWVALGPSLRLGVPLSERWALRGFAGLAVQLVRDTFAVRVEGPEGERVPLYRPEAISLELGAGASYSF